VARFGGHEAHFIGAYAVEGFFQNGGREAHIARVAGSGGVAASVALKDHAGNNTVKLTAGYRGSPEVGEWGNNLYVEVRDNAEFSTRLKTTLAGNQPARLQGNALGGAVDLTVAA